MRRPRVKICGLTRVEDAMLAVELGADAVGFVLWAGSPRHVTARHAADIANRLPPFVTRVGVVVNMPPEDVTVAVRIAGFDAVQLHGDEVVNRYDVVPVRLIKVVAPETDADVTHALALPPNVTVLIDAAADRQARGGTGQRANWVRAAQIARARRVVPAGGLTAETVAEAVGQVRPWAVDVSSGVEESPGVKSARRMEAFFAAVGRMQNSEF